MSSIEIEIEQKIRGKLESLPWHPGYESWIQSRIWQEKYREPVLKNLKQYCTNCQHLTILDLGCGMGGLVVRLQQEGLRVFGIDYSFDYCCITNLRGKRYNLNAKTINAQGECLPLKDRSIDAIFSYDVIEHIFNPKVMLAEVRRIIKSDGKFFLSVQNRLAPYDVHYHLWMINYLPRSFGEMIIKKMKRSKTDLSAGIQKLSDLHYFTFFSFLSLCKKAGFKIIDVREDKFKRWAKNKFGIFSKLLYPVYLFWRVTIVSEWHFMLIPTEKGTVNKVAQKRSY